MKINEKNNKIICFLFDFFEIKVILVLLLKKPHLILTLTNKEN